MFKKVFLLLLLWPLLLPPGFCLCRLDKFGVRTSVGAVSQAHTPCETVSPRCPCCRHKSACLADRHRDVCIRSCDSSEPTPDAPHSPSCPAHPSWEVARAAVSAPAATLAAGVILVLWISPDPASPSCASDSARFPLLDERPCASVPLYLSCRDLLC